MLPKGENTSANSKRLQLEQNEVILQSLSEGVCQINSDGKVTYANASAKRLLGKRKSKVIGKFFSEIFYSEIEETYIEENPFCPILFVLASGETSHVSDEIFLKADKTELYVEYICVPLIQKNKVTGAVISFQDVAERREAELALSQARDLAIETAKTKAAFLANMSHEIRTPLNGILGTTDLLLDSELSEEQFRYVEMLKTSTNLLNYIVNDILDFSKMEAGKLHLESIDFDISKTANETIRFFSTLAKEKNLQLELELDDDVPKLLSGDENKIKQILNNLISNAIKFTEVGRIVLKIAFKENLQDKTVLQFSVLDTGIGIDIEKQAKLFQPFVQADASTTRRFGGTGLGLAICKQLVEIMDGEIGVASEPNEGSNFWFTATFGKAFKEKNVSVEKVKKLEPKNTKTQDLRILIVEDNPINQEIASKMLEQLKLFPECVSDGLEAIKAFAEKEFDIVFMDCQMPRMDGFETTQKIREMQENFLTKPKIIALTANANTEERKKCLDAGMDEYLSKPFTRNDLAEAIGKYFAIENKPLGLDLESNLLQHSLSNIIEQKKLENFLEIEANGKENFIREILNVFLTYSEKQLSDMQKALIEKQLEKIKQKAHNLKGSSANIGLTKLFNLFEKLEIEVDQSNWKNIKKYIKKIVNEFEKIKQVVLEV